MLSANQISVFFNRQYLFNGFISHSNFLHKDRHKWAQQALLISFLKNPLLGQTGHFGPKNGASSWLWIRSKDFFEILHNERCQELYLNYIVFFLFFNFRLGKMGHFGPKIVHPHNLRSTLKIFHEILHNERGQGLHRNYIIDFSLKKSFGENGPFWA